VITSLGTQGGRKYGQFGSTATGSIARLAGFGTTATIPPVVPPAPAPSASGGGGSTQNQPNRRADFDTLGRSRRPPDRDESIRVVSRENADEIIAKAQEIAREKAALNALKAAQAVEKSTQAKMARAIAAEAKLAKLEADMEILRDDEEFLRIFLKMI